MTCPTTKRQYWKAEAEEAAKRQGQTAYRCEFCRYWHTSKDKRGNISNLPKVPVRGVERVWEL